MANLSRVSSDAYHAPTQELPLNTEFSMYSFCLRFLFLISFILLPLKHTHTLFQITFHTSDFWYMEMSHGENLSFVFEKLLGSKRHIMIKPTQKQAQKKQGSFQPVKTTEPGLLQRDLQLWKQDRLRILLYTILRIQILTRNNYTGLLFRRTFEMRTCKAKYRCTDEWQGITAMLRSKTWT